LNRNEKGKGRYVWFGKCLLGEQVHIILMSWSLICPDEIKITLRIRKKNQTAGHSTFVLG
jgi:hypothetical protein